MLRKFFVGLLEWLIVIWVVFEYHTLYNDFVNNKQMYIPGAVLLGLLILLTIDFRKLRAEILVGYFVLMFIPLSFQGNKLIYTFIYLILVSEFYVAFRCCNLTSGQLTLFYKFAKVMTFVGGTSVFLWLMVSVLNIWQMNGYLPSSWGNRGVVESFYYYYAETQKLNFSGLTVVRNTAFFNEAPVYNICLCAALLIETFFRENKSKLRITILVISILSTISTTGQIFLGLLFVTYTYLYSNSKSTFKKALLWLSPFILCGVYIVLKYIMDAKSETESYSVREGSIMDMINVGLKNPIFGIGMFGKTLKIQEVSNSFFLLFAQNGLIGVFLYVYLMLWVPFKYYLKKNDRGWILMMILYFMVFSITVNYYKGLNLMFLGFGMSMISSKRVLERV